MNTSRYTVRELGWYQPPHGDRTRDETGDGRRAAVWHLCDRPLFEVRRVEVSDE